jgi:hypothetical protein
MATTTTSAFMATTAPPPLTIRSPAAEEEVGQEALWIEVEPSPTLTSPRPLPPDLANQPTPAKDDTKAAFRNAKALPTLPGRDDSDGAASPLQQQPKASFKFPSPLRAAQHHLLHHRSGGQQQQAGGKGRKSKGSGTGGKSHVLLMDPQHTVVTTRLGQPRIAKDNVQELAVHKAQQARRLLEQSQAQTDPVRRKDYAQSAFASALEARLLVEPSVPNDLQELLQSACQEGIQAMSSSSPTTADKGAAVAAKKSYRHALTCLGQIIDCVGSATTVVAAVVPTTAPPFGAATAHYPLVSPSIANAAVDAADDISTLGFDNTFDLPGSGTLMNQGAAVEGMGPAVGLGIGGPGGAVLSPQIAAEVLSVTSLNEILDAPIDETNINSTKNKSTTLAANGAPPDKTGDNKSKRRKLLLLGGSLIGKKNRTGGEDGKPRRQEILAVSNPPSPDNAAEESGKAHRRHGRAKAIKFRRGKSNNKSLAAAPSSPPRRLRAIQRFSATVVAEEDDSDPDFDDERVPMPDELKALDVSRKLQDKLREAIDNDGNESVISLHGVPLHGLDVTKKNKKTSTKQAGNSQSRATSTARSANNIASATREGDGDADPTPARVIKPQKFDKVKPKFTAVPRGEPRILMQKSWESLEESGALAGAPVLGAATSVAGAGAADAPVPPPPSQPSRWLKIGRRQRTPTRDSPARQRGEAKGPSVVSTLPSPTLSHAEPEAASPMGDNGPASNMIHRGPGAGDKYRVDPTSQADPTSDKYATATESSGIADDGEKEQPPESDNNCIDEASCPMFLQSCMDVVGRTGGAEERDEYPPDKYSAAAGEQERYAPATELADEKKEDTDEMVAAEAAAVHVSAKKVARSWRPLSFFQRGSKKQKETVMVPPLPSNYTSHSQSVPLAPWRPYQKPLPTDKGGRYQKAPLPPMHQSERGKRKKRATMPPPTASATTPKQYSTVVSPPPLPGIIRPFEALRSPRRAESAPSPAMPSAPVHAPTLVPGVIHATPGAADPGGTSPVATTTAVEQLVRTMSTQEPAQKIRVERLDERSHFSSTSLRSGGRVGPGVPAYPKSLGPNATEKTSKKNPTSPLFSSSRRGPFGGSKKARPPVTPPHDATPQVLQQQPPPPQPSPPPPFPPTWPATQTNRFPNIAQSTAPAGSGLFDIAANATKGNVGVSRGENENLHRQESEEEEQQHDLNDPVPSFLTADTTATSTASSYRTGDSLVHLIKAQQKRSAKQKQQQNSPRQYYHNGRKSHRGVDPADRTEMESSSHRGIDP